MKIALKAGYYAFCALLFGLCATLLVSLWVWLEMRVHTRYIIVGFVIFGLLYSFFQTRIKILPFIFGEILLFLIISWLGKQDLIYYLLKESYLEILTLEQIKVIFLTLLTSINILILFI
ncbi:hypothetical protein CR66_05620 [Campylobacter mucosalis]|uniref:hypothetical protein n=1 Tax=Campylobacter mucosalis TaxID=202 RepID=UPI0004D4D3C2|nr:hypothetical protein [Campylobacter mucosalis]KEA45879.1 hypothetical protein CR66_05620 [Campylobacter mucosalis]QKF62411.1 putative membrane protein [Campylobacter mucosalis]